MSEESARDIAAEAAGAIQVAIRRLAHDYPFHSALIGMFRIGASSGIETAGVTIRQNEVHLLYNPLFIAKCTLPELEGVLHHELNHVIFGHLFLEPKDYPDAAALVVATEVTVNEFVSEPLPGRPTCSPNFRRCRRRKTPPPDTGGSPGPKMVAELSPKEALASKIRSNRD